MRKFVFVLIPLIFLSSCSDSQKATELYLDAVKMYQEGNNDNAKENLKKALSEKDDFYAASFLLGKIYFMEKDFQKSEEIFLKLSQKRTENIDYSLWLLRSQFFEGKTEDAVITVNKLIKLDYEDWRIHFWNAQLAKNNNDFETYFSSLNFADTLLKESSKIYLDLALIWHELGLPEKSALYYTKAEVLNK